MKKILLLTGVLLFSVTAAQAGILSRFFNPYGYDNYYYPPSNVRYYNGYAPNANYNNYNRTYYPNNVNYNNYNRTYYPNNAYRYNNYNNYNNAHRMYNNPYRTNRFYRQPVIHRNVINRKSMNTSNEVKVANQIKDLDKLERKVLRQTYEGDSVKNRIERLEQGMFGAVQTGDIYERYDTLKRMARNNNSQTAYNSYPTANYGGYGGYGNGYSQNGYQPPIFTGSSGAGWRNTLWGNFKNQFVGLPTGLTPQMDPAYMDYFEAERAISGAGEGIDYRTNTGYYKSNTQRSSGTGVTILD